MKTLEVCYQVCQRRACEVMKMSRSSMRYQSVADPQDLLRMRLKAMAASRVAESVNNFETLTCRI